MAKCSIVNYSLICGHSGRIDAEYYKPESLQASELVKRNTYLPLGKLVADGYRVVYENTKILNKDQVDEKKDVRFLQATNVSNDGLWIEPSEIGFVSRKDWDKYPKGRIKIGELLIEVKGQAEKVTIVQDYMPLRTLVTGTLFKLIIKEDLITPEYAFAYFSCKYGKILRDRTKVNTLISYVSKPELYNIPIPIFDTSVDEITHLIRNCYKLSYQSKELYRQAEEILVKELLLNQILLPKKKWHTAQYSEVIDDKRMDAEFFQPTYKVMIKHLSSFHCKRLGEICSIDKGIEVGSELYTDEGKLFIRVSNISKEGIQTGNSDKHISTSTFKRLKSYQIKEGDILCTKDGTIAMCYVIDQNIDGIFSSGIVKLTMHDDLPKEYLAIVMNSIIGKMQAYRVCSGALITHWKIEDMKKMLIPIIDEERMYYIANLVSRSKEAKIQSKRLLFQAKKHLEELIEQEVKK